VCVQIAAKLQKLSSGDLHFTFAKGPQTTVAESEKEKARANGKYEQSMKRSKEVELEKTRLKAEYQQLLKRIEQQQQQQAKKDDDKEVKQPQKTDDDPLTKQQREGEFDDI